ncbi:MAG: GtrA family protein [Beijerinckiaceae bacterium]
MIPQQKQAIHRCMQISALFKQIIAFTGVGVGAAIVHYGLLIGFVEWGGWPPVRATLVGYVGGGIFSYWLNRSLTYQSDRPHQEAGWRFAVVAAVGFCLTFAAMHVFVDRLALPYLPAQLVTTGLVLVWSFLAHKLWTFSAR